MRSASLFSEVPGQTEVLTGEMKQNHNQYSSSKRSRPTSAATIRDGSGMKGRRKEKHNCNGNINHKGRQPVVSS